jgi:hypothetical protein
LAEETARGSILAFVSSGIILSHDWLKSIHQYLGHNPVDGLATHIRPAVDVANLFGNFLFEWNAWKTGGSLLSIGSPSGVVPLLDFRACLVSRKAFRRLKGFDESFPELWDLDFSLRLFTQGYFLGGITGAYSEFRGTTQESISEVLALMADTFRKERDSPKVPWLHSPAPFQFFRSLLSVTSSPEILLYALGNESARSLGRLLRRKPEDEQKSWKMLPGKSALLTTFFYREEKYFLEGGFSFIFADSFIFLCASNGTIRLSKKAAAAIRKLVCGNDIDEGEKRALLRLKVFSPLA